MARPVSKLTLFLWGLFEKDPNITHAQAQPLMKKEGFEVAEKPEMSDDLKIWRQQGKSLNMSDKGDFIGARFEDSEFYYDKDAFDKIRKSLGFSVQRAKGVLHNIMLRTASAAEANSFNVVKHNWLNNNQKRPKRAVKTQTRKATKSSRPKRAVKTQTRKATKPPRPKRAVTARRKQSRQVVATNSTMSIEDALAYVNTHGGFSQVRSRLENLEQEIVNLQEEQRQHESAVSVLTEVQKALRDVA